MKYVLKLFSLLIAGLALQGCATTGRILSGMGQGAMASRQTSSSATCTDLGGGMQSCNDDNGNHYTCRTLGNRVTCQ